MTLEKWLKTSVSLISDGTGNWSAVLRHACPENMTVLSPDGEWPETAPEQVYLVDVAPEKALSVLIRLGERRADFATTCLPVMQERQRESLQRLLKKKHCHVALLAPWRFHWTVCRMREQLSVGLLGQLAGAEMQAPATVMNIPFSVICRDLEQWLELPENILKSANKEGQEMAISLTGSLGEADLTFSLSGEGSLLVRSRNRRRPLDIRMAGQDACLVCLGAWQNAERDRHGWTGFPGLFI